MRPDYETVDRTHILRLALVVAPLTAGQQDVADLWSMMARKYVNQHRDFIVVTDRAEASVPADVCADRIEGALLISGRAVARGDTVEASVDARLFRCRDGAEIWATQAAGTWNTDDSDLVEARKYWVSQTSEIAGPYVVATFRLLTAALATLPNPVITDESYIREKIDLGE